MATTRTASPARRPARAYSVTASTSVSSSVQVWTMWSPAAGRRSVSVQGGSVRMGGDSSPGRHGSLARFIYCNDRLHRQVIGGERGKGGAVRAEGEQRVARPHPHAVEGEKRPARGKGALGGRMAEQLVQPAQRPAERQPFVDVAQDHDALIQGYVFNYLEQLLYL